ncbi:RSP14 protein, partial [Piaya cayana]|nr:RSP14 protein [Piaya cayana]
MAHARISANLPPDIDPTKAPLAFGRRALPKLNEELQSGELLTQQRALRTLCDLVHDPEKVYQAIEIGFLGNLKTLLRHHDTTVRQKTTEALCTMATYNLGRQGLLQNGFISALTELLDDPEDICRKNTHQVLERMAKSPGGAVAILHAGLIPLLISKLKTEPDGIQELILDALSNCLHVDATEALAAGAVPILKEKLTHSLVTIRIKAALVLSEIGTHAEGKGTMCEEVVLVLVGLLENADPDVQASAAGALKFAIVKPQGRFSALGAGAIPSLLKLVAEEKSKARLSAIKALTLLAELPQGRRTLLGHRAVFQQCLGDPQEAVRRAASTAIRVIEWKP